MINRFSARRSLAALVSAAALGAVVAGTTVVAPAHDGATNLRADLAPYTTPRTGVIVGSGVTGSATLMTPAGSRSSIVRMRAEGLQPGSNYGVHVHFGACAQFSGHFQYQHPGPVTRENEVWLDLEANAAGRARDQVRVRPVDAAGQLSVVIHAKSNPDLAPGQPGHPGARIACGDLA